MKKLMAIAVFLYSLQCSAQYKNDNVLFKTVDPADLCNSLQQQKNYLLLDVRSRGEHDDSSAHGLNIGHLKGARNIDVRELSKRLPEIAAYKDQPVYVYCSHSQRSRRASKMLTDSGFAKVYNINGGMTALYYTNAVAQNCMASLIQSGNGYSILSPAGVCERLKHGASGVFILDVRPDSAYRHISGNARTDAYGHLRNTVNIPLNFLEAQINTIPRNKEIIITDIYGGDAGKAAGILKKNGYPRVGVLIEGVERWVMAEESGVSCKNDLYESPVSYKMITPVQFKNMLNNDPATMLLDIRTVEEFNNTHRDSWRNTGQLINAVNIPVAQLDQRMAEIDKEKPVIVYGFGGGDDAYKAAQMLQQQGFSKLYVLAGGIFNLRWTAANIKGQSDLSRWVKNIPDANQ